MLHLLFTIIELYIHGGISLQFYLFQREVIMLSLSLTDLKKMFIFHVHFTYNILIMCLIKSKGMLTFFVVRPSASNLLHLTIVLSRLKWNIKLSNQNMYSKHCIYCCGIVVRVISTQVCHSYPQILVWTTVYSFIFINLELWFINNKNDSKISICIFFTCGNNFFDTLFSFY